MRYAFYYTITTVSKLVGSGTRHRSPPSQSHVTCHCAVGRQPRRRSLVTVGDYPLSAFTFTLHTLPDTRPLAFLNAPGAPPAEHGVNTAEHATDHDDISDIIRQQSSIINHHVVYRA